MIIVDRIDFAIKEIKSRYSSVADVSYIIHLNKADYDELSELGLVKKARFGSRICKVYELENKDLILIKLIDEEDKSWIEGYYEYLIEKRVQKEVTIL